MVMMSEAIAVFYVDLERRIRLITPENDRLG